METILETIKQWCNCSEYRNEWSSLASGLLFFTGWWFILDVAAHYPTQDYFKHTFYICGVLATIALIMINTVSNEQISGEYYSEGCCGPQTARLWLLSGFTLGFISVISSIWILLQYFVVAKKEHTYPGVALFLQNLFIFGSALLLKYGRSGEND